MSYPSIMPLEHIPDWEQRLARQDAFWDCAIIDRPVINMGAFKEEPECFPPEQPDYATERDRWFDTDYVVASSVAQTGFLDYLGDALPSFWPNLGPEVFSAFFGIELEYTEDTSWSKPTITDWSDVSHLQFSRENPYWKKLVEMTDALLEAGRGKYYVGLSDLHPGGDAIAGFRDPIDLNTDLLLTPEPVKALLDTVNAVYQEVFDFFYDRLRQAGQACATWAGIVSSKKWYVPSNDFSCMVSKEMFEEFFLPGIIEECRFLETSIYHLDGPSALRHLDSLLEIPELNAIQWVYGAGNGRASDWLHVYQRCQEAGKGIQVGIEPDELDCIVENLKPEGVWMWVENLESREQADHIMKTIQKWT